MYIANRLTLFPKKIMYPQLETIFEEYEEIRAEADAIFAHMENQFSNCVTCRKGCSDCCNALFDLSLVEAMYINQAFADRFDYGRKRSNILERASEIDRALTRIKRDFYRAEKDGEKAVDIMQKVATMRMPCPLLDENNECYLYDARPITCRLYGIPTEIDGKSRVCGLSKFDKGSSYPTVKLGKIQKKLEDLSSQISLAIESPYDLEDVYVPLSMALLTRYDDKYFGKEKNDE